MSHHKLEEVTVICSRGVVNALKTEGYTIVRSEISPDTYTFRVTSRSQFIDRFQKIKNSEGVL